MIELTKLPEESKIHVCLDNVCYIEAREQVSGVAYSRLHFDNFSISVAEVPEAIIRLYKREKYGS